MPVAHAQRVECLGVHLGDEMRDLAREIVSSLISRRTPLRISICTYF